jgi:hypothetical protein
VDGAGFVGSVKTSSGIDVPGARGRLSSLAVV